MVEFATDRTQAGFDVAKTLTVELTERMPSPDTDPNKTDFSDSDHPHIGLRTFGTLGGEGTRSVVRRRYVLYSSYILMVLREATKPRS